MKPGFLVGVKTSLSPFKSHGELEIAKVDFWNLNINKESQQTLDSNLKRHSFSPVCHREYGRPFQYCSLKVPFKQVPGVRKQFVTN